MGHQVRPSSGEELHAETDFSSAELTFRRYYASYGGFRPWDGSIGFDSGFVAQTGDYWSHTFASRLYTINSQYVSAIAVRDDLKVKHFDPQGKELGATEGAVDRLEKIMSGGQQIAWRYIQSNGTTERYALSGELERVDYLSGRFWILQRIATASGTDLLLTNERNRTWVVSYDSNMLISALSAPDGSLVSYEHDSLHNLTKVTYPASGGTPVTRQFRYQSHFLHALTSIVDENGVDYAKYDYNMFGAVVREELAGGVDRKSFIYYSSPYTGVKDEVRGVETLYYRQFLAGAFRLTGTSRPCSTCGGTSASSITYDGQGFRDLVTDFQGVATDYDYNARGLEIRKIESHNRPSTSRTTETDWHADFNLPTERRVKDAAGSLVSRQTWSYNARGQTLTQSRIDPLTGTARTSSFAYCEAADVAATNSTCPLLGLLKSIDGPRTDVSDVTSYVYYGADHPSCATAPAECAYRKGDLWKVTNAMGQASEVLAYDGAGRVLRQKDTNGVISELQYHPRGWVSARIVRGADDNSTSDDAITTISYYPTGLVEQVTQPDGALTRYTYDDAHRLTAIRDGLGNRIAYTLDASSNRTAEQTFDPSNQLTRQLSRVYNTLNQLSELRNAQQQTLVSNTYDANGQVDTSTDGLGRITDQDYDPLGRLVKSISNVQGVGADRAEVNFAYDAEDRLRSVTDPNGLQTQYGYNGLGDLITLDSPDTGLTSYTYDSAGNRKTQTDARGITLSYAYDKLNRITSLAPPTAAQAISFTYDTPTGICAAGETFGKGRMAKMTDESGNSRFCYNHHGASVRKVQAVTGGPTRTVRHNYDAAGRVETQILPSGATVRFVRDSQGRVSSVYGKPTSAAAEVPLISQLEYLPFGPLTTLQFANGRTLSKQYDLDYGIDRIQDNAASQALVLDFQRDLLGNIEAFSEGQGATLKQRQIGYDGQNRLTSVSENSAELEGFAYDATGNRTQQRNSGTAQPYAYAAGSHRLSSAGSQARNYSAAGHTETISDGRQFVYDDHGRLREAWLNGTLVAGYRYNGKGERVVKLHPTDATLNTYFVYDDAGHLIGEYKKTGTRIAEYVWVDDQLVAIYSSHDGANYQFVETDHLGTPRVVVHPTKNTVIWRWDLSGSAFGLHPAIQDPDGNNKAFVLNLRFPGQYYDSESGLHYNYFRDYDPTTGRYVESDPIGLDGGLSTYAYVSGRPLQAIDPLGLFDLGIRCGSYPGGFGCSGVPGEYRPPNLPQVPCDLPCIARLTVCTDIAFAGWTSAVGHCMNLCVAMIVRHLPTAARNANLYLTCAKQCTGIAKPLRDRLIQRCVDDAMECRERACSGPSCGG